MEAMKTLLWILAPALLCAQSAPSPLPIAELVAEGASVYTPAQAIAATGLKIGDLATKANFERARDRILSTGFFEAFGWRYEAVQGKRAVRVTLQINEPDQFLGWTLDRVPHVDRAAFLARVRAELPLFGDKIPPTDRLLERASAVLEKMAAEKGQREPMSGRVMLIGKDQVIIVFGPRKPPPTITAVRFEGARIIPPALLVKALHDVANGQPYVEANFRLFLDSQIRPMYETMGRLRAAYPKLDIAPAPGANNVVVTVHVDEGPPYTLKYVAVRGTSLPDRDIENEGQFKLDQVVNYSELGKGMNRILDRIKEQGYMKAHYAAQPAIDDEKKTVTVTIDVDPGPRYTFRQLFIKGLDIETEPVIRKLWALKQGEPFRHGYAEEFLTNVRNRGIFDNLGVTKADEKIDDAKRIVDITLTFKGEPPKPKEKQRPPMW